MERIHREAFLKRNLTPLPAVGGAWAAIEPNPMKTLSSLFFGLLILAAGQSAWAAEVQFPDDAGVVNVRDHGAVGDGKTDDTNAIQAAVSYALDHSIRYGAPRFVYFPNGVYLLSDTIYSKSKPVEGKSDKWNGWRAGMNLIGQSRDGVVLRLADRARGFDDRSKPRGMIMTGSEAENPKQNAVGAGNRAFRHYISNLTIDAGAGNAGAMGIDYMVNNRGAITDVLIHAANGSGYAGIGMERFAPGPGLIQRVEVRGFDYGMTIFGDEYSMTCEWITLTGQRVAGIKVRDNLLNLRQLHSDNRVTAISCEGTKSGLVLLDSQLLGGDAGAGAIAAEGMLFVRNVAVRGYGYAIKDRRTEPMVQMAPPPGGRIDEYANRVVTRRTDTAKSLNLPIEEAPRFDSSDLSKWTSVLAHGAALSRVWEDAKPGKDDTDGIQAAIDSGHEVVYLPNGVYFVSRTIIVRGAIRKIIGMGAQINAVGKFSPMVRFEGGDGDSVELEHLRLQGLLEHDSSKTLVVRHCDLKDGYRNTPRGTGTLFIEDVTSKPLRIMHPQRAWMRQINTEWMFDPWLENHGGSLWVFGHKTEGKTIAIKTTDNGRSELLGGFYYRAARWEGPAKSPLFDVAPGSAFSGAYLLHGEAYPVQLDGDDDSAKPVTEKDVARPGRGPGLLRVGE